MLIQLHHQKIHPLKAEGPKIGPISCDSDYDSVTIIESPKLCMKACINTSLKLFIRLVLQQNVYVNNTDDFKLKLQKFGAKNILALFLDWEKTSKLK